MKTYREELWFNTKTRMAFVNITSQVEAAVKKSGVQEGLCLVNAMHITASVYINDDESGLLKDYEEFLERLVLPLQVQRPANVRIMCPLKHGAKSNTGQFKVGSPPGTSDCILNQSPMYC